MECKETSWSSTRIEILGCPLDEVGIYAGVLVGYGFLLILRHAWWTRMGQRYRETLSYSPKFKVDCRKRSLRCMKSRRNLFQIFLNEAFNSLLYIINLFLIVGKFPWASATSLLHPLTPSQSHRPSA